MEGILTLLILFLFLRVAVIIGLIATNTGLDQNSSRPQKRRKKIEEMGRDEYRPLFETRKGKARHIYSYRAFATSVFVGIYLIWIYRLSHIPNRELGEVVRFIIISVQHYYKVQSPPPFAFQVLVGG